MLLTPRHNAPFYIFLSFIVLLACAACGKAVTEDATDDGMLVITIVDKTFVPNTITVAPGDTLVFYNQDTIEHRIMSESGEDLFDDIDIFDSDIIPQGDVTSITIPADTPSGGTLYFYDDILQDMMFTPNGVILVE